MMDHDDNTEGRTLFARSKDGWAVEVETEPVKHYRAFVYVWASDHESELKLTERQTLEFANALTEAAAIAKSHNERLRLVLREDGE